MAIRCAAAEPEQPWQNGKLMEVQHSSWHSAHEFREVVRATTCLSAAVNISSDRLRLPSGGYGYLGVCNDSVAMLQAAMGEPVTQFPCILAGQAKAVISAALKVRAISATGPYASRCCVYAGVHPVKE